MHRHYRKIRSISFAHHSMYSTILPNGLLFHHWKAGSAKKETEKSAGTSIPKAAHTTNVLKNTSVHNVAHRSTENIHALKLFNEN